jgi:hypothetical protein
MLNEKEKLSNDMKGKWRLSRPKQKSTTTGQFLLLEHEKWGQFALESLPNTHKAPGVFPAPQNKKPP